MIFTLEALPAHKGDCLVLQYGEADTPRLVLIDGGPAGTYQPHLRPRIMELRREHGLDALTPLPFEVVLVSHVDDDHINGILDFASELHEAKANQEPPVAEVHTLWHNGFDDIVGNTEIQAASIAAFGAASVTGGESVLAGLGRDESKILASLNQGRDLRNEAAFLEWTVNSGLGPILSVNEETREPIALPGGLEMQIVGPRLSEIKRLQRKHDEFLRNQGLGREDPAAALAAFTDRSVANLSSLVTLAQYGGRTMLLTGDARGDKVLKGLEEQRLIERGGLLEVDVLKVMHHGSDRNVTEQFFEQVRAKHYVFSGDGEHGNPERGCLEMLFDARPEGGFDLYFTYEIEEIDERRKQEAGHEWIPDIHALGDFFEQKQADRIPFTVHTPASGAPLRIDLSSEGAGQTAGLTSPRRLARRESDPNFITRILYGAPDGMRFTQDSPVLREVWLAYAKSPDAPVDLLIVPWESCRSVDVAHFLHGRVGSFRSETGKPEEPLAHVADLPGVAAACLYFDEIWNLLLPQTSWWRDCRLHDFVALPAKTQAEHVRRWASTLHQGPAGGPVPDLRELITTSSLKFELEDPACRTVVLAGLIASGAQDLKGFQDIDPESTAEGWASLLRDREPPDLDPSALIFSISLNRRAEATVMHSVPTTKADAAYRLFELDCGKIGWAVIDSGIDASHPAFAGRVVESYDFACFRQVRSRDVLLTERRRRELAVALADRPGTEDGKLPVRQADAILKALADDLNDKRPTDYGKIEELLRLHHDGTPVSPHGTHVAGILGAAPWSDGGEEVRGMCPDIQLYDFRVLSGSLEETEFAVIGALRLIDHLNRASNFMRIHGANLSLALQHDVMNYACGRTPVCVECEALVHSGVVVVAAAGNQGFHEFLTKQGEIPLHIGTSITDPGNAEVVITVGATHRIEPHNYGVSYFSSRGPTGDGRPKPDIVAPGEKITAPIPDRRTARKGGTSMAAPHVSGAAAMLMARFPELRGRPDRIKKILCDSATDLGRERAYQGNGLLDVLRALQSV